MYSRLMTGMHAQIQQRSLASGGRGGVVVHPLSEKSMLGIVKTKQANDEELLQQEQDDDVHQDHQVQVETNKDGNVGWAMSYSPIDEGIEDSSSSIGSSSSHHQEAMMLPHSRQASRDSFLSILNDIENGSGDDLEDDCVFSLEL